MPPKTVNIRLDCVRVLRRMCHPLEGDLEHYAAPAAKFVERYQLIFAKVKPKQGG